VYLLPCIKVESVLIIVVSVGPQEFKKRQYRDHLFASSTEHRSPATTTVFIEVNKLGSKVRRMLGVAMITSAFEIVS